MNRLATLDEAKMSHVLRVLEACDWNRTRACAALKVTHKTLLNCLDRWILAGKVESAGGKKFRVTNKGGSKDGA